MPTVSPAIMSFNAGELSPMLAGRTDFTKYPTGCRTLLNYIPTVQGPVRQRPGTRFVAEVKTSASKVWLARFEYNTTNAYILEFGDQYIRFYTQHGRLESPPGTPVEVVTPYTLSSLFSADGTCRIRMAQSGDFLYLFHGDYEPRILQRTTATSFTLTTFQPAGGPFKDMNDTATTVSASAETGTGITLTASTAIFLAGHIGSLFLLESKDQNSIKAWEAGKAIAAINDRRRVSNRVYAALNAATTGTATPVHTKGALFDGDTGVQWEFRDPGYGWVRITAIGGGGTTATADVVSRLPSDVVSGPNATTRWAFAAWSSVEGWPSDVAFFRERLVAARRSQVWMSVASAFDDFSARNPNGEVAADQAIAITLASGEINDIQWLLPARDLLAGTAGGEFSIGELSNGEPIGPTNIRVRLQSRFGSRSMVPVQAGGAVLFVQRAGRKVREISYDFAADGYQSTDRTALSEHVTGAGLIDMDYAQEPDSIVWCVRADGQLIGFTWNAEQNVWGWHPHEIGGSGIVESVACIPSPDGASNELWLSVRRTINGSTKRYIEFMEKHWDDTQAQSSAFYVDCGLSYSGVPATVISGLGHLEGQSVSILADGSTHPERTVTAGAVTLQQAASVVNVGLGTQAQVSPMRIEAGSSNGIAQGKTKRIHKIVLRFKDTMTGKYGPSLDALDTITFRSASDAMDGPIAPFSGDKVLSYPGGYDTDGFIWFVNDQPTPSTLIAIYPQMQTQDAR